ncbi:MAG: type IV pilus assembly protein PilM [Acidithiobacillus sp.]|nr:type IV pilus assembly protein PilM [Acidithiobacillus sp.]
MLRMPRPPLLGLDIGLDAVKLVELSSTRGQFTVTHADSETILSYLGAEPDGRELESSSSAIRTILQRSRIRTKKTATALPSNNAIVKIISLPSGMRDDVVEDQIRYEGQQYIPFPMEQVNFDFAALGPDPERKGYQQILLVASKKDHVEDISAILEGAGLKPSILDVRQFSLWTLINHLQPQIRSEKGGIVLIEIGGSTTGVHVFENSQPIYSRDHNFGTAKLTERISQHFGLSRDDAIRMQRFGGLPQEYEKDVLAPFVADLGREILRALDFFQASLPDVNLRKIALFGPGANLAGITKQLASLPVETPDPFTGMSIGSAVNERFLRSEGSAMAVACGLALRRFAE